MKDNHWLLDTIKEMEEFGEKQNLQGFVQGLGSVLEIYAAEAMPCSEQRSAVISSLRK
jgi:hypothetical protein